MQRVKTSKNSKYTIDLSLNKELEFHLRFCLTLYVAFKRDRDIGQFLKEIIHSDSKNIPSDIFIPYKNGIEFFNESHILVSASPLKKNTTFYSDEMKSFFSCFALKMVARKMAEELGIKSNEE